MLGKLTLEDMQLMTLFEKDFHTKVVDYHNDGNSLVFVVETDNIGGLIGRGGEYIRKFQEKLKKPVKVFQASDDLERFARNLAIVPVKNVELSEKNGKKVLVYKVDQANKAMLIGRQGSHIGMIKILLKRRFDIENVVVA